MEQERKNIDPEKTGKFIAELRKAHNLTQDELGDMLFISRKSISKWETGRACPSIDMLKKLSDNFGVSLNDLIYGSFDESTFVKRKVSLEKILRLRQYKTSIMVLFTMFFSMFFILFQYEDNKTKVYYINYKDNNFIFQNGVLVLSKDNSSNINLGDIKINVSELLNKDFTYSLNYKLNDDVEELFKISIKSTIQIDKDTSKRLRNILSSKTGQLFLKVTYINDDYEEISYNLDIFGLYEEVEEDNIQDYTDTILQEYMSNNIPSVLQSKKISDTSLKLEENKIRIIDLESIFSMTDKELYNLNYKSITLNNENYTLYYDKENNILNIFNQSHEITIMLLTKRIYINNQFLYNVVNNYGFHIIEEDNYNLLKNLTIKLKEIS